MSVELELSGRWLPGLDGEISLVRCDLDEGRRASFGLGGVRVDGLPPAFESELHGAVERVLFGEAAVQQSDVWSAIEVRGDRVSGLWRTLAVEVDAEQGDRAWLRLRRLRIDSSEANQIVLPPEGPCPEELTLHLVLEEVVLRYAAVEDRDTGELFASQERLESREELGRAVWVARKVSDTPEILDPAQRRELLPRVPAHLGPARPAPRTVQREVNLGDLRRRLQKPPAPQQTE